MNLEDHQQLQNHVAQTNDTNEADTYYQLAGDWLAVPDRPVDVCTECLDLLDQIRDRQIPLNELPVPYLFSEPKDRNKAGIDSEGARWNPMVAYATDVTAVALADYVSFQRRENKEKKKDGDNDKEDGDNEKNKQDKEVFWWAARDRHQTVKYGLNLWRETAVRSHAHRLGWDNQPLPVFELSVERTPLIENRNQNQLAHQRPGLRESEKEDTLDSIQDGECCPGCGDKLPEFGPNYCSSCLFFGYYDSPFSNDCEAPFAPYIDGEFQSENVMKSCCECGELQDVDDEYVERFMKRYQPVFESMQYSIPMDIPENPQ
jgi:hypothetical protein